MPGTSLTPRDLLRILRRRWWQLLGPLLLGTALGGLGYEWTPPRYRAETVIMMLEQRIPETYVKSIVGDDRLQAVSEQIQNRAALERIARELELGPATGGHDIDATVRAMRDGIEVALLGGDSVVRVAYEASDPLIAQQVTDRLARYYMEANLKDRAEVVDGATQILDAQLEDARHRLTEQGQRLDAYRRRHTGQLPSQLQFNLQSLQGAQVQLDSILQTIARMSDERASLERQVAELPLLFTDPTAPGSPTARQLEDARKQLADLLRRYTESHPEVVAMRQTVGELSARVESEAGSGVTHGPGSARGPAEMAQTVRRTQLERELRRVDQQLGAAEAQAARVRQDIAARQKAIASIPSRESELANLTRDYAALQQTYESLLNKREDSALAATLERRHVGEQFRVLDPATLPRVPENQWERVAMLASGPLLGLAAGVLLAGFLERRHPVFHREADVVSALSLPVLALIPRMDG